MSDEEPIIDDTLEENSEDTSEQIDDTTPQDVSDEDPSSDETTIEYCTSSEVNALFGDISDQVSEEMFSVAIGNAATWIESNLKMHYVPIPTENVNALRTVAIYHSASDILLSLYHGEELPIQYDVWFNKAQSLLEDYIEAYNNSEAEESDLLAHQPVKHSHSRTYNQKRGRRTIWER